MGNNTNNISRLSSSYDKINNTTEKPKLLGEKRRELVSDNNIGSKWSKYNSNSSDDLALSTSILSKYNYNPSDDLALPTSTLPKQPAYNSGDDGHSEKVLSASFGHVEKVNSPPLPTMATSASIDDEKVMAPSEDAYEQGQLSPCKSCGRTFNAKALER